MFLERAHGTSSKLVVKSASSVTEFSEISRLVGVHDSLHVDHGGWEVGEHVLGDLLDLLSSVEEWEISLDELQEFSIENLEAVGEDGELVLEGLDGGDDGGEIHLLDGIFEGGGHGNDGGGVVGEGDVVTDSDGGVGFFEETKETEVGGVEAGVNLLDVVGEDGELSDGSGEVITVEDDHVDITND